MNIWSPGGGRVAALAPGPGDLFVVTTINGEPAILQAVCDYEAALKVAEAFVRAQAPAPIVVKVLCLSGREALRMGFIPDDLFQRQTPEQDAEWRQLALTTLWNVVRTGTDTAARTEALELLRQLGEIR